MSSLRGDASTIIGMQSRGSYAVTASVVTAAAVAILGPGGDGVAEKCLVIALLAVGAALLVAVPGDPFPKWASVTVAAVPAAQFVALIRVVDTGATQSQAVTTTVGGGAALCAFLCVRGRIRWAWAGQLAAFAVYWTAAPDFAGAASTFVTGAGVMIMATFFAFAVRPAAASVYSLRRERAATFAERAAVSAAEQEREHQLHRLDDLVRPVLRRIADNPLDDAARTEALLVEATLRDSIRARALDVPVVVAAARAARERGVTVQLLDDGGLTDQPRRVADEVRRAVARSLDGADAGTVTVRIHPAGRTALATIVVTDGDDVVRTELPT